MFFSSEEFPRFDPESLALHEFVVEHEGSARGTLAIRKIASPYRLATKHDVLYRVDLQISSDNVRKYLQGLVVHFLNGGSQRLRQRIAGTRDVLDVHRVRESGHFDMGVLFVAEPKPGKCVKLFYVPEGSRYPYAARKIRLHTQQDAWPMVMQEG